MDAICWGTFLTRIPHMHCTLCALGVLCWISQVRRFNHKLAAGRRGSMVQVEVKIVMSDLGDI